MAINSLSAELAYADLSFFTDFEKFCDGKFFFLCGFVAGLKMIKYCHEDLLNTEKFATAIKIATNLKIRRDFLLCEINKRFLKKKIKYLY
jgi:hypothetical protein